MHILLVYPTKLNKDGKPKKYKKAFFPTLSLAILDSITPSHHKVTVINDIVEEIDFSNSYDLVGITGMTAQIERTYQVADRFRNLGTKVIIGGIHATALPEEAKQHADAVVIGECDNIWEQILSDCENNNLKDFYKDTEFPDLQNAAMPKWDNINLKIYPKPMGYKLPMMPIYTTRGCPYNCKFCTVTKFFGRTFREKPIANVIKEIESVNADSYFFVDDNIAGNVSYSRDLFKALSKKKISWGSQISTTIIKQPDLIELAAKAGCEHVFIGIESINNMTLKSINKGFNKTEEYSELFKRLRKAGIYPHASIVFGFDNDTIEVFRETIDFLLKNKVGATFFILTPYPGTATREDMKDSGRINEHKWSMYDANHVVFQPKNFTVNELTESYWKTYQEWLSLKNISKKSLNSMAISRNPLRRFIEQVFYEFYYRSVVNSYEHPFSGGVGRII